jgi:hypothetical protein
MLLHPRASYVHVCETSAPPKAATLVEFRAGLASSLHLVRMPDLLQAGPITLKPDPGPLERAPSAAPHLETPTEALSHIAGDGKRRATALFPQPVR